MKWILQPPVWYVYVGLYGNERDQKKTEGVEFFLYFALIALIIAFWFVWTFVKGY